VVVFDLDNLLWFPEMYHLWGGGGAPFTTEDGGDVLRDRKGEALELLGDIRKILIELDTLPTWKDCAVCCASTCDEPEWARECIQKFVIDPIAGTNLAHYFSVSEIHKGSKAGHFRNIQAATGVPFQEMVFFDDQKYNCDSVSKLGVTCYLVPDGGVTERVWKRMLDTFPKPGTIFRC